MTARRALIWVWVKCWRRAGIWSCNVRRKCTNEIRLTHWESRSLLLLTWFFLGAPSWVSFSRLIRVCFHDLSCQVSMEYEKKKKQSFEIFAPPLPGFPHIRFNTVWELRTLEPIGNRYIASAVWACGKSLDSVFIRGEGLNTPHTLQYCQNY